MNTVTDVQPAARSFGSRLQSVFAASGHLCVGIDPHAYLLREWNIADTADGVREFGLRVVDAAHGTVGMVKPQVAFFERHGSAGYAALEAVLAAARQAGLLVIADAKRGDVGSTVEAYAQSWLTAGAPLEADAMTISAFQGVGSLLAAHELAISAGKGLFVLAATSNPESVVLQRATLTEGDYTGRTVSAAIVADVRKWNAEEGAGLGSTGLVLGATIALGDYGIEQHDLVGAPVLAPGFGFQGARFADIPRLYGAASAQVIVSASRGVLAAGQHGLRDTIVAHALEVAGAFGS